jgi:hypothetical protein
MSQMVSLVGLDNVVKELKELNENLAGLNEKLYLLVEAVNKKEVI